MSRSTLRARPFVAKLPPAWVVAALLLPDRAKAIPAFNR